MKYQEFDRQWPDTSGYYWLWYEPNEGYVFPVFADVRKKVCFYGGLYRGKINPEYGYKFIGPIPKPLLLADGTWVGGE